MGLFTINCPTCNNQHQWFSADQDQRCPQCKIFGTLVSQQKATANIPIGTPVIDTGWKTLNDKLDEILRRLEKIEKLSDMPCQNR